MAENVKTEAHLSSAAAFVEGGIQDACDDSCSICLENFSSSDPSTLTVCKHEFHLQCILEWCQRSSQCPMCWQAISLKDPTSQELLEAVEKERTIRLRPARNTAIFHHPTLGDFELQHLPVDANEAELEERILQHLAAAAAMGRAHVARRDGHHRRSRGHGRPQYVLFPANTPHVGSVPTSSVQTGGDTDPTPAIIAANTSSPLTSAQETQSLYTTSQVLNSPTEANSSTDRNGLSDNRYPSGQSSPVCPDKAGPSDLQSLSDSLKTRFNAVSMRYKESIAKSTRGWRERLFSRNQSVADIGSEVRREVNAGIATVSRIMERLDTRESNTGGSASGSHGPVHPVTIPRAEETSNACQGSSASNAAASGSN